MIEQILLLAAYACPPAPHQFVDQLLISRLFRDFKWLQPLGNVGSRIHLVDHGRSFDHRKPPSGSWTAVKHFSLLAGLPSVISPSARLSNKGAMHLPQALEWIRKLFQCKCAEGFRRSATATKLLDQGTISPRRRSDY
jgi:hypothetical protein